MYVFCHRVKNFGDANTRLQLLGSLGMYTYSRGSESAASVLSRWELGHDIRGERCPRDESWADPFC